MSAFIRQRVCATGVRFRSGVMLLGVLAGISLGFAWSAGDVLGSKVRYTLTVTHTRQYDMGDSHESCTDGGCSFWWDEAHDSESYVARSVRPFTIKRTDFGIPHFEFTASVKGTVKAVTSGSGWSRTFSTRTGVVTRCVRRATGSGAGAVAGTVSMKGIAPARAIVEIRRRWSGSTTTTGGCDGGVQTDTQDWGPATSWSGVQRSWLRKFDLRKAFGHTFTLNDRQTAPGLIPGRELTTSRWTLQFAPVEERRPERQRWQVDVRGHDRWSWGVLTGLQGGVNVQWLHRTTLEIEDGKVVSRSGKVLVEEVQPFSEPAGVFRVTNTTKTWPAYELKSAVKRGNRVTLNLFRDDPGGRSLYRVNFALRLAGPQALDIMRNAGVPSPDIRYQELLKRGTVTDSVTPSTPEPARLVFLLRPGLQTRETDAFNRQLPCLRFRATLDGCFVARGGQLVTVTRLR